MLSFNNPVTLVSSTPTLAGLRRDRSGFLPRSAQDKLAALKLAVADLHAVVAAASLAAREAADLRSQARVDRQAAESQITASFGREDREELLSSHTARVDRAEAVFRERQQLADQRAAVWTAAGQSLATIESYVEALTAPVVAHRGAALPGRNDTLESIRQRITSAHDMIASIARAPLPSAEAIAEAHRQVDALAAQGAPDLTHLIDGAGRIGWPVVRSHADREPALDAFPLLVWFHAPALKAALAAAIKRQTDDAVAIPAADRPAKIAAIRRDILALERLEEQLVIAGNANAPAGPVARRHDADPRAVLGLADDAPAPEGGR